MEKTLQKTIVVWFGALICCALWGSAIPCIKLGYQWMNIDAADTAAQILLAGIRFFFAGIMAVLIGSFIQKKMLFPKRESISKVLILAMVQTVLQYIFFYVGLAHIRGTNTAIINSSSVFMAVFISALIFHLEKITPRKLLGCLIGFAGVLLITTGGGSLVSFSITGEGFIVLSNLAYSFSSVLIRIFSEHENPVTLSGWQFMVGGIILTIGGLLLGGRLPGINIQGIAIIAWLAFVSAVAYSLWGILLKYNPVSRVVVFGFMTPIFGVFFSMILLKESDGATLTAFIALILACTGIYICNSTGKSENIRQ